MKTRNVGKIVKIINISALLLSLILITVSINFHFETILIKNKLLVVQESSKPDFIVKNVIWWLINTFLCVAMIAFLLYIGKKHKNYFNLLSLINLFLYFIALLLPLFIG